MADRDYAPYSNIQRTQTRGREIDTHELMKTQIGDSQENNYVFGINSAPKGIVTSKPPPPLPTITVSDHGFEDWEFYFDSVDRNLASNFSNGQISWTIGPMNNNVDILKDIVIQVDSFLFPNIPTSAGKPDFFYNLTAFMEITSLSAIQAVRASNGKVFHFEFFVSGVTGDAVLFTPKKPSMYLRRPFNTLTELAVRFWIPNMNPVARVYTPIPLPLASITVQSVTGTNPLQFVVTSPLTTTSVLGLVGAPVAPGIAVWLYGFNSNDPAVNALVLDTQGNYVINIIDDTTFEIGVDGSTTTADFNATMYIPKNRFAFGMRFTTVTEKVTNNIEINHQ